MKKRAKIVEVSLLLITIFSITSILLFKVRVNYISSLTFDSPLNSIIRKILYLVPFILMMFNIGLLQLLKKIRKNRKVDILMYSILPLVVVTLLTYVHYRQQPTDINYFYSRTGILPNVEIIIYLYLLAIFLLGTNINLYPAIQVTTTSFNLLKQYLYRIPIIILLIWGSYSFVSLTSIPSSIAHSSYSDSLTIDPNVEDVETIAKLTAENAVIVHPMRSGTYPFLGNQVMMRYFLTPRILVTPEKLGKLLNDGKLTPYFIAIKGSGGGYVWPIQDLDTNQIFSVSRDDKHNLCNFISYKIITVSDHLDLISAQCETLK